MSQDIPAQVAELIAGILDIPASELSPSTGIGDLPQWDSLAQVAIITTLEEEFDLDLDAETLMGVSSVSDIISLVMGQAPSPAVPQQPAATLPAAGPAFQSLEKSIMARAGVHPAKTAVIFGAGSITYRQLVQGMERAAAWLWAQGIRRGDCIALGAERCKEFLHLYFGAHLLGAPVLNLDPDSPAARLEYVYRCTAPKLQVGLPGGVAYGDIRFPGSADNMTLQQEPDAVADIMFTTGTTGEAKGVPLTHANLAAAAGQINSSIGNTADDVEVLALPICHSFGMGRARCVLSTGGTLVLVPGFTNPARLFAALEDYRATGFSFVPAAWKYLRKMSGDALATHARHLRYIEIGSAAMDAGERRHLIQLFPRTRLCMHYGLTEASRSAFTEFHADSAHPDTAGKPAPGVKIAIFSAEGTQLPPGSVGEICVSGNHVTPGYLGQAPADSRYGEYFRTGDWGMIDSQGYLSIHSRMRDLINTGGKKVSPDEVETCLCTHPGVAEAACVPAPDPQGILGEVVKAVLVPAGASRPADEDIRAYAAARLESYQVPVVIEWRDSLPKTSSGKLQRRLI